MMELMNIALEPIPEPNSELSLLHENDPEFLLAVIFYMDDEFMAHSSYQEQFNFLRDHLFPRLLWVGLKLSFSKLKLFTDMVTALEEDHEVGGRVSLKSSRIIKILD